jgi:hypothetical protein
MVTGKGELQRFALSDPPTVGHKSHSDCSSALLPTIR